MKYFRLSNIGVSRKEVGLSPQSTSGFAGDIQKHDVISKTRINFNFKLPAPILDKGAKATDLLNVVMIPGKFLVISERLSNLLASALMFEDFQKWKINVRFYDNSIIEGYYLFLLTHPKQSDFINYNKSHFYVGSLKDHQFIGKDIAINNFRDYINTFEVLRKEGLWLKHHKIILDLSRAKEDIFRIDLSPFGEHLVSEKLKNEIEGLRLTGIVFKEITDLKGVEIIY